MRTQTLTRRDSDRAQRFTQCFNRMLSAFPSASADAVRMQVYFDALRDLPIEAIERAGAWLQRNAGEWFPSAATWHERAALEQTATLRETLKQAREEPWHVECSDCDDTGWVTMECGGGPACGRTREHLAHTYAVKCPCRPTNRTYARNRDREFAGKGGA